MSNQVTHNREENRYEIHVDGILAGFTQALEDGDVVTFPHTVVFDQFEGQGLASELVTGALDDIRVRGKVIVPSCPYVARFVDKHPDYKDLLAA
jgi:predicted GNAT family acetyltransferase